MATSGSGIKVESEKIVKREEETEVGTHEIRRSGLGFCQNILTNEAIG